MNNHQTLNWAKWNAIHKETARACRFSQQRTWFQHLLFLISSLHSFSTVRCDVNEIWGIGKRGLWEGLREGKSHTTFLPGCYTEFRSFLTDSIQGLFEVLPSVLFLCLLVWVIYLFVFVLFSFCLQWFLVPRNWLIL